MKSPVAKLGTIVTAALLVAGLAACSPGSGAGGPVLPDTPLVDLMPSQTEVVDEMGPEWSQVSGASSYSVVSLTFPVEADQFGKACADATIALHSEINASIQETAQMGLRAGDSNTEIWRVLRAKSPDAATAFLKRVKESVDACMDRPSARESVVETELKNAFAYETSLENSVQVIEVYVLSGDLVIWTFSLESIQVAEQMAQLQLDKIAELVKKG